jgi:predicted nuclease with TOPRIM domain
LRLRTKLTHRINRSVAWRVEEMVEGLREEVAGMRRQLDDLGHRTHELADRGSDLDKRLGEVQHRLDAVERESSWSANELARLAPQAAAFEARLEQQARPTVLTGGLADLPEARLLLDVVREEHARVRARLSLVSAYEERLRRLEQRTAPQGRS